VLLDKLYKYITDKINESKDDDLILVLQSVVSMLAFSGDGKDLEVVQLALLYLYKLSILQIGVLRDSEKKFGKLLQDEGKFTISADAEMLKKLEAQQVPMPERPLSMTVMPVLEAVSMTLMTLARIPVWSYSYSLDDDQVGRIRYRSIRGWQSLPAAELEEVTKQTYLDFYRNFKIGDKNPASFENFDDMLRQLVAGTSYAALDQDKIISWLKQKGGQATLSFLHELFIQGDFSSSDKYETVPKGSDATHVPLIPEEIKTLEANWHTEEGLVFFAGEMVINRVHFLNQAIYLYANENGEIGFFDKPQFNETLSAKLIEPYLMRVKVKIKLTIDGEDRVVLPKIISLHFINYTDQLSSPERLLSHNLVVTSTPTKR